MLEFTIKINLQVEEKPTTTTTSTTTAAPKTTTSTSTSTTTSAVRTTSTSTSTTTRSINTTSTTTLTPTTSTTSTSTTKAPSPSDFLTIEDFGGQAYYKRFDGGLNYKSLGNGTTQITYTGTDINFTAEDLNKSFCGLFANRNPEFVDYAKIDEYYPGIVGSRYSKVIQVIDSKNIIVDFEYNLNVQNGKGYVFFDNSKAWDTLLNTYIGSSTKSNIRLKEHLSPLDVYVIPQFSTKRMPTNKEFQISTFTSNHARIKIGLEDYFQWGGSGRNNTNFKRIYQQGKFMFDPNVSNYNWISNNVYWMPPHRRYPEAESFTFQFFGTLGSLGNQSRIIAIVNNKALEEQREMQGKITSETFVSTGIGFVYAGGTYTGNGSNINDDVQNYIYLLTQDYEHKGPGFMDLKANDGGGLYFVSENTYTDFIPEDKFNPPYFYCKSRFTKNYDGLDPAMKTKTYFPEFIFEIADGNSWYQVNNLFWNEGWGNASNAVQIGRFVFWVPKAAWWKNIYAKWYNRGEGAPVWSTKGFDIFSGKKVMLNHIARTGKTYTFGRHYTTDRIANPPIKQLLPNQIRSSINWSLILQKRIDDIDPVKDIPANCFPMELQPGDQFKIVGYGDEIWTVTQNNRGDFPNWVDEITFWNGNDTNYSQLPYNFTVHTLDKALPTNLPPTFELTMIRSCAEELIDGTVRDSVAIDKSNIGAPININTKLGDPGVLASNPFGHVSYNHQEITMWAKNFDHNGYYRQSNNQWPLTFTIKDPDTGNDIKVGPLRKYSKGYTMINCDGFVGQFAPQAQFATRDKIRKSQGINLPEDQKEMVRLYNCKNMNGLEKSTDPYVKNYADPNLAPDMPQPCRDLLNSLP